jgi:hypothetical protein
METATKSEFEEMQKELEQVRSFISFVNVHD